MTSLQTMTHLGLLALLFSLGGFSSSAAPLHPTPAPAAAPALVTFTVTDAGDDSDDDTDDGVCATDGGTCTLRAAIQQANATGGAHTIEFALGAGIPTISVGSGFPEITATLTMDGATGGADKVEVVGPGAGPGPGGDSGFFFTSGGNTVKNLIIHSFDGSGLIFSSETGNTLEGCWIGLDKAGGSAPNAAAGLFLDGSSDNMLGGDTADKGNVLDAVIFGFGSGGNMFEGNLVGTTTDGTAALGSGGGLSFVFASNGNTIVSNVISGSGGNGISILFGSAENEFIDNLIGTDLTGTTAIPNAADGVHIADGHFNLFLGNVISGNGAPTSDCASIVSCDGIDIRSGSSGNVVNSNHIGVNLAGTAALGNRDHGIFLGDGASSNAVGDAGAPEANVISGNGRAGIEIADPTTVANSVAGNFIGTNADGTAPIPNGAHGILIRGAVSNFIGGPDAGAGNMIAFNGGNGVTVESGESNAIRGNSIGENMGLGIDLGDPGPTPNDPGDGDGGANTLQNYPLIASVEPGGGTTLVGYLLNSTPSTTFTLDFYAVGMPDPSGFGEGEMYLGSETVTTSALGTVSGFFSATGMHEHVTATATDPDGNTSEFSTRVTFLVNSTADDKDKDPADGLCDTGNFITRDFIPEPECTLRAAIEHVTANPGDTLIEFNIPVDDDDGCTGDVCTIAPDALLPELTVAGLTIDAFTQPGACSGGKNGCTPKVVLNGEDASTGENAHGFQAKAATITIKGFVIQHFEGRGVFIEGFSGVKVTGNYIGTNAAGTAAAKNDRGGILILNAPGNTIGGETDDERNVIAGNGANGIEINGAPAQQNKVWGNYIGLDVSGEKELRNDQVGVLLTNGAHNNEIGGTETGRRNVIGGHFDAGIAITKGVGGNETRANKVWGNYIGLDVSGTEGVGNAVGVSIRDATDNEIGGTEEAMRNVIADHSTSGVGISGKDATGNKVLGNYIGTDKDGQCTLVDNLCPLGNGDGVWISGAPGNEVGGVFDGAGNVIGGGTNGVVLIGEDADGNKVLGNHIGLDATGTARLENTTGVVILNAPNNEIGGTDDGARNIISGNRDAGVHITGNLATGNTVRGNYIGLDKDGNCENDAQGYCAMRNTVGVSIFSEAQENVIGGAADGAGNVIAGNFTHGVHIWGEESEKNRVEGNIIGLKPDGETILGNREYGVRVVTPNNSIGGTGENTGNVIAGNMMDGILVEETTGTKIQGNFIGTDKTGTKARGNLRNGIYLKGVVGEEDPDFNTIGGLRELFSEAGCAPPCNLIGGNGTEGVEGHTHGIRIEGGRANNVQGNLIGTGIDGAKLGNAGHGIYIIDGSGHRIGQDEFDFNPSLNGLGNVIAHNGGAGLHIEETASERSRENSILSNRFFDNTRLGIDLKGDGDPATGVTANDSPTSNDDNDAGPNDLQNFPSVDSVKVKDATMTTIDAGLFFGSSRRGQEFIFEYFASPMADPSGHGEGRVFLGAQALTVPATHDPGRAFGFSMDVSKAQAACSFITMTATDQDGNTSEHSEAKANLVGCLEVTKIEFEHLLRSGKEKITEGWTVDGNVVKITVHVYNGGEADQNAQVTIHETADNIRLVNRDPKTFTAGDTTKVVYDWDTMGYSWKRHDATPLSERTVEVQLIDPDNDSEVDRREEPLMVRPRPVVLVHGLWQFPEVWTTFKRQLTRETVGGRPDWPIFAVGDRTVAGRMNTGALALQRGEIGVPVSHEVNGGEVSTYVEGIRDRTKAAHVDLVAHGSGGLIARRYITSFMVNAPQGDDKPVVTNLVTLGTPHLGTACADAVFTVVSLPTKLLDLATKTRAALEEAFLKFFGTISVTALEKVIDELAKAQWRSLYELTTAYVRTEFNPDQRQRGVPFYFYGTEAFPTSCTISAFSGDGFTEIGSALANKKRISQRRFPGAPVPEKTKTVRTGSHFTLPKDLQAIAFARSVLDVFPLEPANQRGDGDAAAAKTATVSDAEAQQQQEATQINAAFPMPVPRGETATFSVQVPEVTAFGLTLVLPDSISTTLRDPDGVAVDEAPADDTTRAFLRTHTATFPQPGAWTLDLVNHGQQDTVYVPVVVWMQDNPFRVALNVRAPDIEGRVQLTATVTHEGESVDSAAVAAQLAAVAGTDTLVVDLFDDGLHGDGDANDGVYGAEVAPTVTGIYGVSVWAVHKDRAASTLQFVELEQGAGPDLALDVTTSAEAVDTGVPFTLSHTVVNHGPSEASSVVFETALPASVTVDAATASTGSCTTTDDVVTCALGTLALAAEATVTLSVTPGNDAIFTHEASVSTDGADWNPSNNTASVTVIIGTPTATEHEAGLPQDFALHANYPNPFNPQTEIRYDVKAATHVVVQVFNAVGQPVATLADDTHAPGRYTVTFDGGSLPSGVYFYRIQAGTFQAVRTMVLVK